MTDTAGEHYRISQLSVNKQGSVICVTDEMMKALREQGTFTEWLETWQKKQAIKRRKKEIIAHARVSGYWLG